MRLGIAEPSETRRWTQGYWTWLTAVRLEQPLQQVVLADAIEAVEVATARLKRLEAPVTTAATSGRDAPLSAALQSLWGVGVVTAVTLVAELGDLGRFPTPRPLLAYLGRVPSEHSSGSSQRRGRITRAGNAHVRHMLVQAAWHYRHAPQRTKALARRQAGQPAAVTDVARELAGFVWALARAHTDHQAAQAQAASASLPAAATVAACARTTMLNGRWPVDGRLLPPLDTVIPYQGQVSRFLGSVRKATR